MPDGPRGPEWGWSTGRGPDTYFGFEMAVRDLHRRTTATAATTTIAPPMIPQSSGESPLAPEGDGGDAVKVTETRTLAPSTTTELGVAVEVRPGTVPIVYEYVEFARPEKVMEVPMECWLVARTVTDQFVPGESPVSVNVAE